MRLPPITSTSRAQTEGQSCGQTEGRRVISVIAFMSLLPSSRFEPPAPDAILGQQTPSD